MKLTTKNAEQYVYDGGWQRMGKHSESEGSLDIQSLKIEEVFEELKNIKMQLENTDNNKKLKELEDRFNTINNDLTSKEDCYSSKEDYYEIKNDFESLEGKLIEFQRNVDERLSILTITLEEIKKSYGDKKARKNIFSRVFKTE